MLPSPIIMLPSPIIMLPSPIIMLPSSIIMLPSPIIMLPSPINPARPTDQLVFEDELIAGIPCHITRQQTQISCWGNIYEEQLSSSYKGFFIQMPHHESLMGLINSAQNTMEVLSIYLCRFSLKNVENELRVEEGTDQFILEISTKNKRDQLLKKLLERQNYFQSKRYDQKFESIAMKQFVRFDIEKTDLLLSKSELQQLMTSLNVDKKVSAKALLALSDFQAKESMTIQQFLVLVKVLECRTLLYPIFKNYTAIKLSEKDMMKAYLQPSMSEQQFHTFLKAEQGETLPSSFLTSDKKSISFFEFCRYISSHSLNCVFEPDKPLKEELPLSCYYVNSSHNTYLVGNQFTSMSSANVYYKYLKQGVRCLELDLHNSSSGPIISHGFTFTSSISFESVVQAIRRFTIEDPQHTPIILSFEDHCDENNQKQIVSVWGQIIPRNCYYTISDSISEPNQLPTLKALRGKIIIQGTGDFCKMFPNVIRLEDSNYIQKRLKELQGIIQPDYVESSVKSVNYKEISVHFQEKVRVMKAQKAKGIVKLNDTIEKMRATQQYYGITPLYGLVAAPANLSNSCWEMANIAENNLEKAYLDANARNQLAIYNERRMMRIYPFGLRFDSSNYNPINMLQIGAQLISMNVQKIDIYSVVNRCIYLVNGNCGYKRKPSFLIENRWRNQVMLNNRMRQLSVAITFLYIVNLNPLGFQIEDTVLSVSFVGTKRDMEYNAKFVVKAGVFNNGVPNNSNEAVPISLPLHCKSFSQRIIGLDRFVMKGSEIKLPDSPPTVELRCEDSFFGHLFITLQKCGSISLPLLDVRKGFRSIPIYDFAREEIRCMGNFIAHITIQQ